MEQPSQPTGAKPGGRTERPRVGGFEVLSRIGRGGMGAVFKARQLSVNRVVALKILPRKLARNEHYLARFLREARSAARLSHPNVVQAISAGQADGYYYFAMEYVAGRNLRQLLDERRLAETEALTLIRHVTLALGCAHEAGMVHRDVKPDNVLVTPDGIAKLADLGLAREGTPQDTSVTLAGTALGTPGYISPEQVRGQTDLDGRNDIYSLGATLFHALAGRAPYDGNTAAEVMTKHLTEPPPDPRALRPDVSPGAAAIVLKSMAKEPDERYGSIAEMLEDVDRVLEGEAPVHAPRAPKPAPATAPADASGTGRKRWMAVAACLLILAGTAGLTAGLWPGPDAPPPAVVIPEENTAALEARRGDERRLAAVRDWEHTHPAEFHAAIARYRAVLPRLSHPLVRSEAEDALEGIRLRRQRAAEDAFLQLEIQADKLAGARDYDAAIRAYERVPERFADLLDARAREAADRLRAEADRRIRRGLATAREFADAGQLAEALAEIDKARTIHYQPLLTDIEALRKQFEADSRDSAEVERRKAVASAERALRKVLEDIEAAVAKGDLEKAARLGEDAARSERFQVIADRVTAAAAVCRLLPQLAARKEAHAARSLEQLRGKELVLHTAAGVRKGVVRSIDRDALVLEHRFMINGIWHSREHRVAIADVSDADRAQFHTPWEPATPDEAVAEAIVALATGDADRLAAVLDKAGEHPLHGRYAWKLADLTRAKREAAAKAAWAAELERLLGADALGKTEADAAEKTLDTFRQAHGTTAFAACVRNDIARIEDKIATARGGPALLLARKIFKGRVDAFESDTLRIKLFYDFSDGAQADDWTLGRWQSRRGDRVVVRDGALELAGSRAQILTEARFTAATIGADFVSQGGTYAATLLVCSDGRGNHYELCGLYKTGLKDVPWQCQLCKYLRGRFPRDEFNRGLWPSKPSPFATTKSGRMELSFDRGSLRGRLGELELTAKDHSLRSGSVGVWAFESDRARFDNIRIEGTLERRWVKHALRQLGLRWRRKDPLVRPEPGRPRPRPPRPRLFDRKRPQSP
jgi:serine/threonine-protein kinase